jgi:hypothetical protein
MSQELLGRDMAGAVDFSLAAPVICHDDKLVANTVSTVTCPAGFNRAFLSYAVGTNVWMTMDGSSPVVPSGPITSTQELYPSVRRILNDGTQVLKFISDTASYLNIRFDQGQ